MELTSKYVDDRILAKEYSPLLLLLQFSNVAFIISMELLYRDLIKGVSDSIFSTIVDLNIIEL